MLDIYVDADACPVKDEIYRVAGRHGLAVHVVSNRGCRVPADPRIRSVVVSDGFDAADNWIAEHIGAGDIVVTADIPLAARCIARQARALGPTGQPFTEDSIGMALATRDLMSHLRETGVVSGGPASFSRQDRSRFLGALETMIQAIRRRT